MEQSILTSIKKTLGLAEEYTAFDEDILLFINGALSTLHQLGLGPEGGVTIEDKETTWAGLELSTKELNLVKPYIYAKARLLFDPPNVGYLVEALSKHITECEWRLTNFRQSTPDTTYEQEEVTL